MSKEKGYTRREFVKKGAKVALVGAAGVGAAELSNLRSSQADLNSYYVLTKLDASLLNSRLHPNSSSPNYNIVHDFTDIQGQAIASQLPSNIDYLDVAQIFTAIKTLAADLLLDLDNTRSIGSVSLRLANLYALIISSGSSDLILKPNLAIVPDSDAAKDISTTIKRFRDAHLSRSIGVGANASGISGRGTFSEGILLNPSAIVSNLGSNTTYLQSSGSGSFVINAQNNFSYQISGVAKVQWNSNGIITTLAGFAVNLLPDIDNSRDVGSSSLNMKSGFFKGQVKSRNKNTIVIENLDETQANATIPAADTALKTYALPANNYTHVIVEGEGYISVAIGATQQDLNIKVRSAAVQVGNTVKFNPPVVTTAEKIPFSIKASFVQNGAVTLDISIGAAIADANTTVFLNSLRVYGES